MYDQLPQRFYQHFAEWVTQHHIYIIHLRRRCVAMQFASQMEKAQRHERTKHTGLDVNHFTNRSVFDALEAVQTVTLEHPKWQHEIWQLEQNQKDFENYLRVHMARTPVFEVAYEDLDGPFQQHWFRSILAFLGVAVPPATTTAATTTSSVPTQAEDHETTNQQLLKMGSRLCERRLQGLGGPAFLTLSTLQSRIECLRLRELYSPEWQAFVNDQQPEQLLWQTTNRSNATTSRNNDENNNNNNRNITLFKYIQQISLPPQQHGQCRWTPACHQVDYIFQYSHARDPPPTSPHHVTNQTNASTHQL